MRKTIAGMMVVSAVAFASTACEIPQPCEGMTATENEKKVLDLGGEVERNDNSGNECELNRDLTWSEDH